MKLDVKNQPTGVSTFASRTRPSTAQSLQKSFLLSNPGKIELKKFSSPSENKKYATAQPNPDRQKISSTMTGKINGDNGFKDTEDKTAGSQHCIKAIAGEVVNRRSVHIINFGGGGQVIALKSATALILTVGKHTKKTMQT